MKKVIQQWQRITASLIGLLAWTTALAQWDTVPPDAVMPQWEKFVPELVHPDPAAVCQSLQQSLADSSRTCAPRTRRDGCLSLSRRKLL